MMKKKIECEEFQNILDDAQLRVQEAVETTQKQLRLSLSPIVTKALDTVITNNKYDFDVRFGTKGNLVKTSQISFVIIDRETGAEYSKRLEKKLAGGVINLISLAIRVSLLILSKKSNVLIIDEGLVNLRGKTEDDISYEELAQKFIDTISHDLGIQVIMVTHEPKQKVGNVINLENA